MQCEVTVVRLLLLVWVITTESVFSAAKLSLWRHIVDECYHRHPIWKRLHDSVVNDVPEQGLRTESYGYNLIGEHTRKWDCFHYSDSSLRLTMHSIKFVLNDTLYRNDRC